MHKSQLSQSLTRGTPASDQAPHSGRPASSRSGAPSTSRGLLPIDGKVIAVEDVFGCSSPDIPVLVVVYRNTSKERVVYTVRVSKTSTQHDSGWPTTSVLCIYSTVTWGLTDRGLVIAKPPLPPPAHLQGGMESQKVSTPPPPPPHLQTGTESRTGIPKASPPHPQADIEDQTVSTSVNQTHRPAASHFDQLTTPSSGAGTTSASLQPPGVTSEASVPGKYMDFGGRYLQYVPYAKKVPTDPKA